MNRTLQRGWNWCRRFRNRCGYGVHSPYDFYLITFVIYEKLPFYAFSPLHHLRRLVYYLHGHREKVDNLLFRMVNHLRPHLIFEFGTGSGMSTRYMSEVGSEIEINTFADNKEMQVERIFSSKPNIHYLVESPDLANNIIREISQVPDIVHIAHTDNYKNAFEQMLAYVDDNTCFIISCPYLDKAKTEWWKEVVKDNRTGVTFDLYDIGIIFFDKKRVKENRVVNFL